MDNKLGIYCTVESEELTPKYAHDGDSGMDLCANLKTGTIVIKEGTVLGIHNDSRLGEAIYHGITEVTSSLGDLHSIVVKPNARVLIPSGVKMEIPQGLEGQVRGRSGLALKHGIQIVNGIGTIDSTYRGDIGVILLNTSSEPFTIKHGDRIAQLIIAPVVHAELHIVDELKDTARGEGGYGHTGQSNEVNKDGN